MAKKYEAATAVFRQIGDCEVVQLIERIHAMAGYKVSVASEMLPGLLGEGDGMAKLVEAVLNQVLEAQMSEHLEAAMHERCEERQGYRNGTRVRTLYTRVGPV